MTTSGKPANAETLLHRVALALGLAALAGYVALAAAVLRREKR